MTGRFFELAPSGQDYFKQSQTRLDYIADQQLALRPMPKTCKNLNELDTS